MMDAKENLQNLSMGTCRYILVNDGTQVKNVLWKIFGMKI